MIKLAHVQEVEQVSLSEEVKRMIRQTLEILDTAYGEQRDVDKDLGGFVAILETEEDLVSLLAHHLNIQEATPEYAEEILTEEGQVLVIALFLLSSDYSITVIMPRALAPLELLKDDTLLLETVEKYCL